MTVQHHNDCWHCGESIPEGVDIQAIVGGTERAMCCHGCLTVATLIDSAGLGRYYEFRDALPERPELAKASRRDFAAWDRDAILEHYARPDCDGFQRLTLVLENVHCAACAWLIHRYVGELEGVAEIRVDVTDGRAHLNWNPERTALSEIAARLAALGYRPHLDSPMAGQARNRAERLQMLKYIVVAGLGMMQVMSYALAKYIGSWQDIDPQSERFFLVISMVVAVPVCLYSGQLFYRSAWRALRQKRMSMDIPVASAMLLALFSSVVITTLDAGQVYFDSVVMFIFFLLLGRYAVLVARQNAGQLHSALARSLPVQARRLTESGVEDVTLVELEVGDRVQVGAGETLPADGVIESGNAMIDESLLSGESTPRRRVGGDEVLAGSLVREGNLTVRVENLGQSTVLSGIVRLLDQARSFKPRMAQMADRLASYFIVFVLTGAAIAGIVWWQIDPARALPVMISVLVVSCPCALALGTPVALAAASRGFARLGVLISTPDALEKLPKITHVVFDKTGTLTRPEMTIGEVRMASDHFSKDEACRLAGRLERVSRHPVATAFAEHDDGHPVSDAEAITACGVTGTVDGVTFCLGKPEFAAQALEQTLSEPDEGQWVALVGHGELIAWFRIDSPLRDGAHALVDGLRANGLKVLLASGDRLDNVARVARELRIEGYHGDMSPSDKLELVRRLQSEGARVAMVGDGINDAPVLAGADISLALAEGADIARSQSDLVVTGRGLQRVSSAFALAPKVRRIVRQNLALSFSYNATALPFAAAGFVPPWLAAIGMSASSLVVVLNAQRLGRRSASGSGRRKRGDGRWEAEDGRWGRDDGRSSAGDEAHPSSASCLPSPDASRP
ncbi:cadmium-translocating P-type ATPase [Wenzhouxiangella sp. AB-CW3]|uniref:heavy metal translocating P-type ATPase n=1 Tax=Wenzhouxiangella sp. AB-CW3 TaxID=2771012 RepID=UPI00168B8306|nr:heavy metal translocating P-type ATPase [Wenzhouxiangella sp. AB-CW3]QOC22254.1 cadmium-translocating P-type ATPase [Wenzhouxiangella sp. AB-CW3]